MSSPGLAVTVPHFGRRPYPVQVTEAFGSAATSMPAGRVSTKVVSGMVLFGFGSPSTMLRLTGFPTMAGDGEKVLLPVGACSAVTRRVAFTGVSLETGTPPCRALKPAVSAVGVGVGRDGDDVVARRHRGDRELKETLAPIGVDVRDGARGEHHRGAAWGHDRTHRESAGVVDDQWIGDLDVGREQGGHGGGGQTNRGIVGDGDAADGAVPEQAEAVVRTIVKTHADLFTKGDLRELELKLDAKFTALDGGLTLLQWMLGLLLVGVASLVIKSFSAGVLDPPVSAPQRRPLRPSSRSYKHEVLARSRPTSRLPSCSRPGDGAYPGRRCCPRHPAQPHRPVTVRANKNALAAGLGPTRAGSTL